MSSPADAENGKKKVKSGSQKRRMKKSVKIALTEAERQSVEEKTASAGLSLSAYGRACLLGDAGPRARRAPPVHSLLLAEATAALNRVGNNINQIAHHLNAGGRVASGKMTNVLDQVSTCLQALLAALGRAE
jgi:hypothetical protein